MILRKYTATYQLLPQEEEEGLRLCVAKISYLESELLCLSRGNQLGIEGWAAVSDALERVTSLTSLNGCGQYAAIRAGGLAELKLEKEWELGVWAARFLERSGATLTALDVG